MLCRRTPNSSPSPGGEDTSPELGSGAHVHLHRATGRLNTAGSSLLPLPQGWVRFPESKQCFHNFVLLRGFFFKDLENLRFEMKASPGLH